MVRRILIRTFCIVGLELGRACVLPKQSYKSDKSKKLRERNLGSSSNVKFTVKRTVNMHYWAAFWRLNGHSGELQYRRSEMLSCFCFIIILLQISSSKCFEWWRGWYSICITSTIRWSRKLHAAHLLPKYKRCLLLWWQRLWFWKWLLYTTNVFLSWRDYGFVSFCNGRYSSLCSFHVTIYDPFRLLRCYHHWYPGVDLGANNMAW